MRTTEGRFRMSELFEIQNLDVVEEPYATVEQRRETAQSGMWLFLGTEVMFFGGLFATYTVYRHLYGETFRVMSRHLDVSLGTLNTAVLLTSSLTMALAVHAIKEAEPKDSKKTAWYLLLTLLFGVCFLGIKTVEWIADYHHGLFPGHWMYQGPQESTAELFFCVYFAMVGLHALHVVIGVVLLCVFVILTKRGQYSRYRFMPIEVLGLYWHYVDLVWIFLYPLFYLVDPI